MTVDLSNLYPRKYAMIRTAIITVAIRIIGNMYPIHHHNPLCTRINVLIVSFVKTLRTFLCLLFRIKFKIRRKNIGFWGFFRIFFISKLFFYFSYDIHFSNKVNPCYSRSSTSFITVLMR